MVSGSVSPNGCSGGVVQLAPLQFRVPVATVVWSDGLQAVVTDVNIVDYSLLPVGPDAVAVQLIQQSSGGAILRLCGMVFTLTEGSCLGKAHRAQSTGQDVIAIGAGVGAAVAVLLVATFFACQNCDNLKRMLVRNPQPRVVALGESPLARANAGRHHGGLQINPLTAH